MADAGLRETGSDLKQAAFLWERAGSKECATVLLTDHGAAFASALAPTGSDSYRTYLLFLRTKVNKPIALTEAEPDLSGKSPKHSAASQ